jgi:phage baseplate assembly protein W
MNDTERFGRDLDLGFLADEEGRTIAGPWRGADLQTQRRSDVRPRTIDLAVVEGRANLVQALILRLKTARGELAGLGHPGYGSRHHALVGEPNTARNRELVKLYVLECMRQEPRLERVLRIDVRPAASRDDRGRADIELAVLVRGENDPLNLVVPFSFAEAPA